MANGRFPRPRPANIDALVSIVQQEFPRAAIHVTGRARTIRRQAELMAERIRADRAEFLRAYAAAQHITEMDEWWCAHPTATSVETIDEFERIIQRARARGAVVSNHLSDTARDISWPLGIPADLDRIEARMTALGARVLREPTAAGGRHWHVDW